ncbi:hypothetical protein GCM10007907_18580 [Chitinimonas prasina]|uniref:Xylulose 5-phosphate/Fructose 6-phosphate phosphoketolase N-terminal domain-containing protein n=1 Tax=Chitinimonas prasina TaxID=1434937 RepID=A0ABQ5YGE0_9NEIS|nr:xylulose 5-phosphate 3-epimerase [Chitinimonas prasina]GLR13068.1 hypothetical protein GCM10007907_18580 [Chitinimonas prasina]
MNHLDQLLHTAAHDAGLPMQDGHRGFPYRKVQAGTAIAYQPKPTPADVQPPPELHAWAQGYGVIQHDQHTQARWAQLIESAAIPWHGGDSTLVAPLLHAADRLCSQAMWLVAHMTYCKQVRLDGTPLAATDFKSAPEGHTGGALNMVPAYVGYMLANALTGQTRSWLMGQGHCVAAIEAVNTLLGNQYPEQAERYPCDDAGLSQLCQDFYSYALHASGRPQAPLGSHVNAHTAGGVIEGGYLGFAELQYVHMPLPGETLVSFLSDGAFEEQRGSDWIPRWWRAEDCGAALPVMILNGRRIEQRSGLEQDGGVAWFIEHLRLNGFEPMEIDGTDPAAFAWAILHMESSLAAQAAEIAQGRAEYPVRMPYAIAHAPKGFGFPGAGTNLAHNLPLGGNPSLDASCRQRFNQAAAQLWVHPSAWQDARRQFRTHTVQGRPAERDHAMAQRHPDYHAPSLPWRDDMASPLVSPMAAFDATFCAIAEANPQLRVRVANPDELRSNGMGNTLERFKHRVTHPEPGNPESLTGGVITALNEEAVISAALANKGGLNLAVSYEAFAVKMLGALRQEANFARNQSEAGRPPGWLSVPLLLSSHAWENGKNELSHQDTTLAEAWLAEASRHARLVFPPDWNSAVATLDACYRSRGQLWCVVAPKRALPVRLPPESARQLTEQGWFRLVGKGEEDEKLILVAVGSYQLTETLRASRRLDEHDIPHAVVYVYEPARLGSHQGLAANAGLLSDTELASAFPHHSPLRIIVGHTRPGPLLGAMRRIDTGPAHTVGLGFLNQGGTLDTAGMLYANRCSWAHIVAKAGELLKLGLDALLTSEERDAVLGLGDPADLR